MNVQLVFKVIIEAPVREPRKLCFLRVIIFQLAALLTLPQESRIKCERSQHGIVSHRRSVNAKNRYFTPRCSASNIQSHLLCVQRASESLQAVMLNNKTVSSMITTLAWGTGKPRWTLCSKVTTNITNREWVLAELQAAGRQQCWLGKHNPLI